MGESDPKEATLESINLLLGQLQNEIKDYCQQKGKQDIVLYFEDKRQSRGRKQVEDIEGDVIDMKAFSR
jgi:hypothetical protein